MEENSTTDLELFKALHALQYDRIAKLESQENYITTFVTGLSTITLAYAFSGIKTLTKLSGILLPLIFVISNIVAILYIKKTRKFVKLHQERAKQMRSTYAQKFQEIYESFPKHDSNKDWFNRTNYFVVLHILISMIGVSVIVINIKQP